MRDLGRKISRLRLSRYAPVRDRLPGWTRWLWVAAAAWVVWVGLLSDHSFYRLWRLSREAERTIEETEQVRHEVDQLTEALSDPRAKRERAEQELRSRGMAREGEIVYRIRETRADSLAGRQP